MSTPANYDRWWVVIFVLLGLAMVGQCMSAVAQVFLAFMK